MRVNVSVQQNSYLCLDLWDSNTFLLLLRTIWHQVQYRHLWRSRRLTVHRPFNNYIRNVRDKCYKLGKKCTIHKKIRGCVQWIPDVFLIDLDIWPTIMRLVHLCKKTEILKYWDVEYIDPLDYMRAAMAAIRWGQPSSNYSNRLPLFIVSCNIRYQIIR